MIQTFTIPGTLPDLNAYINAERSNKYAAAKMKKGAEKKIVLCIKQAKIKPVVNYPVTLVYFWFCPDKRVDKDNRMFGQKFCQDALIGAGILRNDGWGELNDPIHVFDVDKNNPRIVIKIDERNLNA